MDKWSDKRSHLDPIDSHPLYNNKGGSKNKYTKEENADSNNVIDQVPRTEKRFKHARNDTNESSSSSTSDSSSSDNYSTSDNDRRRKKKHRGNERKDRHKKEKKKKKKTSKKKKKKKSGKEYLEKNSRRKHTVIHDVENRNHFERNYALADALESLFQSHPSLASDLPFMLIRMVGGATFDLTQMSDSGAAQGLERVMECLSCFGVQKLESVHSFTSSNSSRGWTWKSPTPGTGQVKNPNQELLLVKVVASLLDQIGITIDAIKDFEKEKKKPIPEIQMKSTSLSLHSTMTVLQKQTIDFLDRYTQKDPNLTNQLVDLCQIIIQGEVIALEGITDVNLRNGLETLFRTAGLIKTEMDLDDDTNDVEDGAKASMGYGIPDPSNQFAIMNLESIVQSCQHHKDSMIQLQNQAAQKRATRGPFPEHLADQYNNSNVSKIETTEDSDDDTNGPLPEGMMVRKHERISKDKIKLIAEHRQQELDNLRSDGRHISTLPGEREEWMVNPGEHDLLKEIKSGGMKSRTFERKSKSSATQESGQQHNTEIPMDSSMKAELSSILQAHRDARGPTLIEQHRINQANLEREKKKMRSNANGENSFEWSRDKDLDAGRRVDKEALQLIMGGANNGLQDKFQGGFKNLLS
jgi:hypothetical protein